MPNEKESQIQFIEDSPTNFELKNDAGVFRIKELEPAGEVLVEIENNEGKKAILNELLPEGSKIFNYRGDTRALTNMKQIFINTGELEYWGVQYFLSILHEIGHVVISQSTDGQKDLYKEFVKSTYRKPRKMSKEEMSRFNTIHSKIERDAWAYAVRELKKILTELDIDTENIFSSRKELKEYVHELLLNYKEWGGRDIKNMEIPEKDKQELLQEIDKLYTRKKVE